MKDKWNDSRKNGRRHNRFDVKLTDEELAVVKRKAEFAKMPVGRFLRVMAVKGEIKYYELRELIAIKRALESIANNVNQVAKVVNSTGSVYQKDIEELQEELLRQAKVSLDEACIGCEERRPYDCLVIDIKDALALMGQITGETRSDEIISEIFARFCVGK